mgnify:CR=1 FL=1
MSFGFQIFDANGVLRFDSTDITWNQVTFYTVAAGGSDSRVIPELSGKAVAINQIMIDPPLFDRKAVAHTVSVNGTTVDISGGSEEVYIIVLVKG